MAIDETLRLQVQAVYESNDLSVKKVIERFSGYEEIKEKTVEMWVKKYGWKKNRFSSEEKAIEELIDTTLPLDKAKEIVKNKMKAEVVDGEVVDDEELDDEYAGAVGKELAYKVLNLKNLQEKIAANLIRSEGFARNARNIGVVATHHNMLINTYQTIYGKQINLAPLDPTGASLSEEEIRKLSDEDLKRLIAGGK